MINILTLYCDKWGMEVKQARSEIMIFRKRGRLSEGEKWEYNSFTKHIKMKNVAAKSCLNATNELR